MHHWDFWIRNLEAENLLENFLISALTSILIIRAFLSLTGFPQLGGHGFHIAHVLWGGFFMMVAIFMFIMFLTRSPKQVAAVIGGIGFGAFIDELGKFLTSDNNYFYQPTISLIYLIFVLLYLVIKILPTYRRVSQKEYLVNALDLMKEAVLNDLDIEERNQIVEYLSHCDSSDPVVKSLKHLLTEIDLSPLTKPGLFAQIREWLFTQYYRLAGSEIFSNLIILVLTIQIAAVIYLSASTYLSAGNLLFDGWGKLLSACLAAVFLVIGFLNLPQSRRDAFSYYRLAVLILLLLTQFFEFYRSHILALFGLLLNLLTLLVVDYVLHAEVHQSRVEKPLFPRKVASSK